MTDQQLDLDAIESRASAATPGPWGVYGYGGDSLIEIAADLKETGCGYSARRTVCRFDEEPLDNDPTHAEWTAEEDWAQVQADAAYIAAMPPEMAKALVAEIRRLRARLDAVNALCDREQRNAGRWENPLPVPEWVDAVRRAAAPAAVEAHVVADDSDDPEPARRVQCNDCGAVGEVFTADDGRAYLDPSGQIWHASAATRP